MNGQPSLSFLSGTVALHIDNTYSPLENNWVKSAEGFPYSMIDDKDCDIPLPLIMYTCTALHHALLVWQQHQGVRPKVGKSKLKADSLDSSNYINYMNDNRIIAF
jgi:hypothetical protein